MATGDGDSDDDADVDGDAGTPALAERVGRPGDADPVGTTGAQLIVSAPTMARHATARARNRDQGLRGTAGASRPDGPTAS